MIAVGATAAARAASVLYIRGGGYGHGIGMSQYGAEGMAEHGAGYQAILAHYYTGTQLGPAGTGQTVRVLLSTGQASFTGASLAAGKVLAPATTYTVTTAGGKLVLRAGKRKLGSFAAPLIVTGATPLVVPGLGPYRGALQFSPDGSGGVQTVDAVGLDDYVRGVVAAEMPSSWAPAAIEAQAVAARTYAITTSVGGNGYDLYSDTRSQMYGGVNAETAATDAAVAATSGQIVTYDGQPAVTYFFSSSGGHTESVEDAWPGATPEPWLQGVPDPYDGAAGNPYHSWSLALSATAAAAKLRGLFKGAFVGIQITRRGTSPRIISAQVVGTRGRTVVSGGQLQGIFGLLSTDAAFTTISTQDPRSALTGTIFPAPRHGQVTVQSFTGGAWQTASRLSLSRSGAFRAMVPAGRYRVLDGALAGPVVAVR